MAEIIRIQNIESYTQEIVNGTLILTPKLNYITEDELSSTLLTKSTIIDCTIRNGEEIISEKRKYRSLLDDIWKSMPTQKILQTTTFNMKLTDEKALYGYNWSPTLHMSIQGKDSNNSMKEIINMVKVNKYSMKISIQLETGKIVLFKINL